jgi:nucleotide-binding universal stress UspA family protein
LEQESAGATGRYRRIVVKLSGEAFTGEAGWGTAPVSLAHLTEEILSVHEFGVQVAVVLGGGNYFRGRTAAAWGIDRTEADTIGMLGTVEEVVGPEPPVEIRQSAVQGDAAEVLLEHACGADLLVVGSRGYGGFERALLGSVSRHCVEHAPCPVVVVPAAAGGPFRGGRT